MGAIDTGDTAFVLVAAALVMFMTPGWLCSTAGMVRSKNVLGTVMQSFVAIGVVSVVWALLGYTLAFGPDVGHVIGCLEWVGLRRRGPGAQRRLRRHHPRAGLHDLPGHVRRHHTRAHHRRLRRTDEVLEPSSSSRVLWSLLVYSPIAHWVWGVGGWIRDMGALDFAGGTVVHISSAAAALAAAFVVGRRKGFGKEAMHPHNVPMTVLGAGILWFGWFGFNAGSALAANGLAANALRGHPPRRGRRGPVLGGCRVGAQRPADRRWAWPSGAVAGLVAITPASGFVGPDVGDPDRHRRRGALLPGRADEVAPRVRRLPGRRRRPRRGRDLRRARHRTSRADGHQRRRGRRGALRQPDAAR